MKYIIFIITVLMCVCLTYGQPPGCAGIMCSPPNCMDPYTPVGGCCPTCPGPGRTCSFRGRSYLDGEEFKDDCNTCTCIDGDIGCTQMFCPDDKPGSCPQPTGAGICTESCSLDAECPRRKKCCSNGCGHSCMRPQKAKACFHKGVKYRHGASFEDECNTCTCTNGAVACTEMACGGKPGSCPVPVGNNICLETCLNDYSCPGEEKCCNNGCGQTCMQPIAGGIPCVHQGVTYKDGENFMDDCNTCMCRNGKAGCTRMACPKKTCFHNGINYNDRETFRDECNVCVCSYGVAECTLMTCPEVKPGTCPALGGTGICVDRCTTDLSCPGKEKCCSNGCGTLCSPPSIGGQPCAHYGISYNDGETFKDDCNLCICNDGLASCTTMACPGGSCLHNGVSYQPGETFKDDCNTCTCNDGIAACTAMACPGGSCLHNGVSYQPGETFKDDCNTCTCNDGIAACTLMACPGVKPGECPAPVAIGQCIDTCITDTSCPGSEKCCSNGCGNVCLPPGNLGQSCLHNGISYYDGETFKDDCNTCTCNNGKVGCTLKACPGIPCLYKGISYNHGETFKDACNTCTCNEGQASCTAMACNRPCIVNGVTYNDGESFKDDCNTCTCSDGNAACTQMACPGSPCRHKGMYYNHGETFKDDCNTCTCNDGLAACTLMACPGSPCLHKGMYYNDGETFKDDCNTCTCNNGKAACTLMACPERTCMHKGATYQHGESFNDDCNTCTCTNGKASCTQMACPGSHCLYKGMYYNHGETFKDDCNTCTCNDGRAVCTLMYCPLEKPGTCPDPIGGGICVNRCTTDFSCPGRHKCCSHGCGTDCTLPMKDRPCYHNGTEYLDGQSFKDDCNTCTCKDGKTSCTQMACGGVCIYKGISYNDGESFMDDCNKCICSGGAAACTLMACPKKKPGTCPLPSGVGVCMEDCTGDLSCPGIQKCCSNGCGHVCMKPDFGGRPCYHSGNNYTDGESFKDDCNTCTCTDGNAACTLMACPPKKPCYHNGITRQNGEQFQDDCNTCVCTDGKVECTLKACGMSCDYKGKTYQDGESFKENCNTCTCKNGNIGCTLRECSGEKPGKCPRPALFTRCISQCNGDKGCPGSKKCCNNWCGNTCMDPIGGDRCAGVVCPAVECPFEHTPYIPPGECCQVCRPPVGDKAGTCPRRRRRGPCANMCTTDFSCPGQQKCCDNRCGRSCVRPNIDNRCRDVTCPILRCRAQYRPYGRCCPICRGRGGGGRRRWRGRD